MIAATTRIMRQTEHAISRALPNCTVTVEDATNGRITLSAKSNVRTVTETYDEPMNQQAITQLVRKFIGKIARVHLAENLPFAYIVRENKDALWLRVVGVDDMDEQAAQALAYASSHLTRDWYRVPDATVGKPHQVTFKYVRP